MRLLPVGRAGTLSVQICFTTHSKGEDAWCVIAVFDEEEWHALCEAAGHLEWKSDPRFTTLAARKAHEDELDRMIAAWTAAFSPNEVMEKLQAAGVHAGIVNTIADLFSCPQLLHRQQWQAIEHCELGRYEYEAPPFLLSETPAKLRRPSPCLGEHNDYVFGELLRIPKEEIEQLKADGVIA